MDRSTWIDPHLDRGRVPIVDVHDTELAVSPLGKALELLIGRLLECGWKDVSHGGALGSKVGKVVGKVGDDLSEGINQIIKQNNQSNEASEWV